MSAGGDMDSKSGKPEYGDCAVCFGAYQITKAGLMRRHRTRMANWNFCPGSAQKPA